MLLKLYNLNCSDLDCFMVCLQSEKSSCWAKEAPSQFECRTVKSSNEWATEKIGFGRQVEEKKKWHEVSARGESQSWQGSHNLVAKKPATRLRTPRIVSNKQKTNTPSSPHQKNPTESNGRKIAGRAAHMHFSTLQVTTLLPLNFQHFSSRDSNVGLQGTATYSNLLLLCTTAIAQAIKAETRV